MAKYGSACKIPSAPSSRTDLFTSCSNLQGNLFKHSESKTPKGDIVAKNKILKSQEGYGEENSTTNFVKGP